jgi:excisionase family DNA binding protein
MQNLYRHFDSSNNLLYVGISINAVSRLSQHKQASHWFDEIVRIEIQKLPDRETALEAERKAISEERPLHNIQRPSPKQAKRAKDKAQQNAINSKKDLLGRIVQFNPMYSIAEVAEVLKITEAKVRLLVSENKIGWIKTGERSGRYGIRPIIKISGWQLIDFIEALHIGDIKL